MVGSFDFPGRDRIKLIQPNKVRVKVFIDFWNVVINARSHTSKSMPVDVIWPELVEHVVQECASNYGQDGGAILGGCYIFGSYTQGNGKDVAFKNSVLDKYGDHSGLFFDFQERVQKETAHKCQNCGEAVQRSSESGVDILLTVEMIKHSNMRDHEYLALVSSDRDYIPLLRYLKDQGQRVVHISPGPPHRDMRAVSWKQVDLRKKYARILQITNEDLMLVHDGTHTEKVDEIIEAANKSNKKIAVIDIRNPDCISDGDLAFLFSNMWFNIQLGPGQHWLVGEPIGPQRAAEYREAFNQGTASADLPCLIEAGEFVARMQQSGRWKFETDSARSLVMKQTGKAE